MKFGKLRIEMEEEVSEKEYFRIMDDALNEGS